MAKKQKSTIAPSENGLKNVSDYRFPEATRKNNPPAKIAAEGFVPLIPKAEYSYSPRRPPELRFDPTGRADQLPELLAKAANEKLTVAEVSMLAEALRINEPWLEWAGKREAKWFAVDPVALHIHERVSAQAILKVAAREDVNRSLFADPEQEYNQAVQFYKHDVDWSNRLILGDSLQVMSSLARREDLAGKVQMIYIDPPYGIKFGSNFQPEIGKREVKDKESDLTREPEMVRAYRDTWRLGVHSYLAYLHDRVMVSKELLADTGSIFVQIGDENVHLVRDVLDEIFGRENFMAQIAFSTTTGTTGAYLAGTCDYLLWFAKRKNETKYKQLYRQKELGGAGGALYTRAELADGVRRIMTEDELVRSRSLPDGARAFGTDNLTSSRVREGRTGYFPIAIQGTEYLPGRGEWKTNRFGIHRLLGADRIVVVGETPRYVRYFNDFPAFPLGNLWSDVGGAVDKNYVVQTGTSVVQRCMLMTTDPGDLILDPTCGSGTSAAVAEQWGRRWITIDTSRVAIAIARQRLLTSRYDFFKLNSESQGVVSGFRYKKVPHIGLKSIAQNPNLDPIFAKHEPILDEKLAIGNAALANVTDRFRNDLRTKLVLKQKQDGKKSITDADRRRWDLPAKDKGWRHWDIPFDTDPDYSSDLKKAVQEYRAAWRAKMDEVNSCIAANGDQEELVDQPEIDRKITRVSGPFTVEAVQPPEMSLGNATIVETGFAGEPEELEGTFAIREVQMGESAQNLEAYLEQDGGTAPHGRRALPG